MATYKYFTFNIPTEKQDATYVSTPAIIEPIKIPEPTLQEKMQKHAAESQGEIRQAPSKQDKIVAENLNQLDRFNASLGGNTRNHFTAEYVMKNPEAVKTYINSATAPSKIINVVSPIAPGLKGLNLGYKGVKTTLGTVKSIPKKVVQFIPTIPRRAGEFIRNIIPFEIEYETVSHGLDKAAQIAGKNNFEQLVADTTEPYLGTNGSQTAAAILNPDTYYSIKFVGGVGNWLTKGKFPFLQKLSTSGLIEKPVNKFINKTAPSVVKGFSEGFVGRPIKWPTQKQVDKTIFLGTTGYFGFPVVRGFYSGFTNAYDDEVQTFETKDEDVK